MCGRELPSGHLVLYAALYSETALDRLPSDDPHSQLPSLYTRKLLQGMEAFPKINVNDVHQAVAKRGLVIGEAGQRQG
jgi:hypothetical protein